MQYRVQRSQNTSLPPPGVTLWIDKPGMSLETIPGLSQGSSISLEPTQVVTMGRIYCLDLHGIPWETGYLGIPSILQPPRRIQGNPRTTQGRPGALPGCRVHSALCGRRISFRPTHPFPCGIMSCMATNTESVSTLYQIILGHGLTLNVP